MRNIIPYTQSAGCTLWSNGNSSSSSFRRSTGTPIHTHGAVWPYHCFAYLVFVVTLPPLPSRLLLTAISPGRVRLVHAPLAVQFQLPVPEQIAVQRSTDRCGVPGADSKRGRRHHPTYHCLPRPRGSILAVRRTGTTGWSLRSLMGRSHARWSFDPSSSLHHRTALRWRSHFASCRCHRCHLSH